MSGCLISFKFRVPSNLQLLINEAICYRHVKAASKYLSRPHNHNHSITRTTWIDQTSQLQEAPWKEALPPVCLLTLSNQINNLCRVVLLPSSNYKALTGQDRSDYKCLRRIQLGRPSISRCSSLWLRTKETILTWTREIWILSPKEKKTLKTTTIKQVWKGEARNPKERAHRN